MKMDKLQMFSKGRQGGRYDAENRTYREAAYEHLPCRKS